MRRNKFIISGGGTGGHIFPAISIADELKFRFSQSDILFVGAKDRMEMVKVPAHGYKIKGLWISGLKRKFSFSTLLFPLKLIYSLFHSLLIILKFKPEVVIGTGGFASGPIVFIATVLRIPTLIQEQNSYPGITNRILSRSVNKICVSYSDLDKYFPTSKIKLTGNPIRNNISNAEENYDKGIKFYDLDINRKTLLIIGGSQGSREINKHVYSCIDFFNYLNIQVIWQCGKIYYNQYEKLVTSDNIKLYSFLERIDLAFSVSDYIVSRAGAGSISELCVVGKPVIFIPSPNVAEDHQTKNANALVAKDAAILIQEQNSYPGITNRILSRRVNKISVSYSDLDKYFPTSKIKLTGNPIRNNISNAEENYDKGIKFYDLDINQKTLLIIGGSQGSREINKHVYNCIDFFNYLNIQVIWQCGKIYYNQYEKLATSENIKLYSFLERIDLAFSVSDYIVSRAGACSISELCVVGKPVIFIPSPNVAEDHQTKNAKSLVDNDAAILIQEEDLESMFKKTIKELNSSRDLQYKLSKNIKSLAFENATRDIVDEIEKLIKI